LLFLKARRHLGIHTEMFSDGVVELFESGVITNEAKTLHRGKIVASFVLAPARRSTSSTTTRSANFTPLTTSTTLSSSPKTRRCSDQLGARGGHHRPGLRRLDRPVDLLGFGGQVDFIRGAARSKGGKPVIALPSTAKDGTISRIVDSLTEGSGVVTTRADVHYVVTEHGVASLFGKCLRDRAQELIAIAHPDFRDELRAAARRRNLL